MLPKGLGKIYLQSVCRNDMPAFKTILHNSEYGSSCTRQLRSMLNKCHSVNVSPICRRYHLQTTGVLTKFNTCTETHLHVCINTCSRNSVMKVLQRNLSSCTLSSEGPYGSSSIFGKWTFQNPGTRTYATGARVIKDSKPKEIKAKVRGIQKDISPLTTKRIVRRKKTKDALSKDKAVYDVMAYATSEEIYLEDLVQDLAKQGLYEACKLPNDVEDVLYAKAKYRVDDVPREIFFFREGSVVFWNMPEAERTSVLEFMRRHQCDSYDMNLVEQEYEHADFTFTEKTTDLVGDEIHLQPPNNGESTVVDAEFQEEIERHTLEKYTFSNALALSVKLAIWEESLAKYVDSIDWVLEEMKAGKKINMHREEVLRKTGELLTLRHLINLSSDLLDTPDFYWDRESLEKLYIRTCNYFNIGRRTEVMNKKINYCAELTELLTDHLNDRHHTRLEWMIIILIMVEVGFEILHSIERYWGLPVKQQ